MTFLRSLTHVAFSTLLAAMAGLASGAPVKFHFEFDVTAPPVVMSDLIGAHLAADYVIDVAQLTPSLDFMGSAGWITTWPATNTMTTLRISNSALYDGIYSGMPVGGSSWSFTDADTDIFRYPDIEFNINGNVLQMSNAEVRLPSTILTIGPRVVPAPYDSSQVLHQEHRLLFKGFSLRSASDFSYAVIVPEPANLLLSASPLLGFCAARLRAKPAMRISRKRDAARFRL